MALPQVNRITTEEFYKFKENSNELMEFVDGVVYKRKNL